MIKTKVEFWRAGFFQQTFRIALIGWIKAGPPKYHFCFDHVNRLIMIYVILHAYAEQNKQIPTIFREIHSSRMMHLQNCWP